VALILSNMPSDRCFKRKLQENVL